MGIPTIDISLFYEYANPPRDGLYVDSPVERTKAVNTLLASLSTYGAFKITGHGISGSMIQRMFESSADFFGQHRHIKKSAAGSRLRSGRLRGYLAAGAIEPNSPETFVAGPLSDRQAPTPWPIGVRGDIFQMAMQPFSRDCANLHHDLLHILEEALGLWDSELVSHWAAEDGEVRLEHQATPCTAPSTRLEGLVSQIEGQGARTTLALAFQNNAYEEIVVVCGAAVRKWIQIQLGDNVDGSRRHTRAVEDGQRSKYSVSYIGYENNTTLR
ncbi:hypothetical protein PG995_013054 [Apiospora arundinis]